ncbi:MAG: hypothetical protein WCA46_16765, partial [Actinocatenispora sp.]
MVTGGPTEQPDDGALRYVQQVTPPARSEPDAHDAGPVMPDMPGQAGRPSDSPTTPSDPSETTVPDAATRAAP